MTAVSFGHYRAAGQRFVHARSGAILTAGQIDALRRRGLVRVCELVPRVLLCLRKPAMKDSLTPKQRAALAAARDSGLYRDRHGFRAGYRTAAPIHPAAVVRPLIRRGLVASPHGNGCYSLTQAGRAALAPAAPPPVAPIRSYVD